ncbi:hypothetical protein GL4_1017 [Methyloceanibacter caenitepidi]|uniref:Uncharacterized protein n=1 Tax=Methyloceanibacter caenitepidi TaxID=1384459 RepID=A0A0A8K1T0_9HYPH|nr:hypothetical protein GL4_1017 [Methyloceanibacter caenitepidi]
MRLGRQLFGKRLDLRLRRRQRRLDGEEPGQDPLDIPVDWGSLPAEGNRGDRGGRIGADAGQLAQALLRVGKTAPMLPRHHAGAGMEISGAGVVAEAGPGGEDGAKIGLSERVHIRPASNEVDEARRHRLDGGLLQHDLAQPHLIGILQPSRRRTPRQCPALAPVPSQQRRRDLGSRSVRVNVLHKSSCHAQSPRAMV